MVTAGISRVADFQFHHMAEIEKMLTVDTVDNNKRVKIGYLSGTFDLFHVGHLNLLRRNSSEII